MNDQWQTRLVSANNKLVTNMQSGFRKQRSTTDNLVRLETFIREAFVQKQHAVPSVLIWKKHGIMKDL